MQDELGGGELFDPALGLALLRAAVRDSVVGPAAPSEGAWKQACWTLFLFVSWSVVGPQPGGYFSHALVSTQLPAHVLQTPRLPLCPSTTRQTPVPLPLMCPSSG